MDDERVSGTLSELERGGVYLGRPPQQLTWAQFAEEQCRYYIVMGVTADEYWNGDYTLLKYYRQAYREQREIDNYDAWLQGLYVYEAIVDCTPILRALSKEKKPIPYPLKPYEITKEIKERYKEKREREQMEKSKAKMESFAAAWNKKFKEKQGTKEKG